jgi:uncharacterized protein (TIGR03067 family)
MEATPMRDPWRTIPTIFCLIASSALASSQERQDSQQKILGQWRVDSAKVFDGKKSGELFDHNSIVRAVSIDKDTITFQVAGDTFFRWEYRADFKKEPTTLDLKLKFPPKQITHKGICKLDGDNLIIHIGVDEEPKDFEQRNGLVSILIKCTKKK